VLICRAANATVDWRITALWKGKKSCYNIRLTGPVAQLVEQRIENPRVGSSILPQATNLKAQLFSVGLFLCPESRTYAAIPAILRVPRPLARVGGNGLFDSLLALSSQKTIAN
jgi:hypothetical protein